MKRLGLPEFELCAQCIYYRKILEQDYSKILPKLNDMLGRCYQDKYNNIIEEIFCKYITNHTATDVFHKVSKSFFSVDDITKIIIFKQSADSEINLLAKVKCYKYGKLGDWRKDFLKWQIDKLILNDKIDMEEEYKNYKLSQGSLECVVPSIIIKNLE